MSPTRMEELMKLGVAATETMNINRKGVSKIVQMHAAVKKGEASHRHRLILP